MSTPTKESPLHFLGNAGAYCGAAEEQMAFAVRADDVTCPDCRERLEGGLNIIVRRIPLRRRGDT